MTDNTEKLAGLSSAKRALLEKLVAERRAAAGEVRPRPRPERVPLSFGQERLWVVEQLAPGSAAYNEPVVLWLSGALDVGALERAINEVVRRHESLRTAAPSEGGRPFQRIAPSLTVPLVLAEATSDEGALQMASSVIAASFDLARGPLVRALLVRVEAERHLLAIAVHHLLIDGWSINVVLGELARLYNGEALPEPPLQYADYALWQREWLDGERMDRQLAHWREHLEGCPSTLDLPADRPRPPVQSFKGSVVRHLIPPDLYEAMEQFSRRENVTPFMTLFAAWTTLLHRLTGQEDLPLGVGLANRPRAELESIVGFFVNTLVLRTRFDGAPTFLDLLARVRETTLGAQANQDAPLSRVLESMKLDRAASHMPFVQVMLFFQNYAQTALAMNGLRVSRVPLDLVHPGSAQTDIALFVNQDATGELLFQYSTDLFDRETIERLAGNFVVLLRAAIADASQPIAQLPLLTEEERVQLAKWNDTRVPYHHGPLISLVQAASDKPAVTFRGRTLTYAELRARASALADELRASGVKAGDLVGLFVERSLEMVIGIVAILEAGGAYVPLDPSYPAERLAFMLGDAGAKVVVTQRELREQVPVQGVEVVIADAENVGAGFSRPGRAEARPHVDDLAYVIFTSGSTGRPKGVQITQRSAANLLQSVAREPGMNAGDTICAVSTLSFDIALLELVLPLTVGAHILLADRDTVRDGNALGRLVANNDVTIMQATPATWRMLLDIGWRGKPGLKIISTGEALPRELAERLLPCGRELWNLYGPTETTVYSALGRIESGSGPISIGRPVANTQIHIVDRNLQLLPPGVPGELLIGGDGLARGYLGRPDLTAEKFIPDPFSDQPEARLYRAGDLATWRRDGTLEVLGRMDHQVKLRGFRIELGEIEAVLAQHADVEQAVVHCREDRPGDKRLVAYTTGGASTDALREHLRKSLPDYMIPAAFVALEQFPLTPNGKVNRHALPAPEAFAGAAVEPPQTREEREMATLWSDLLGRRDIGRNDNFFDLGGHSLLAMQMLARLEKATGVEVPLRVLFDVPTVATLARHVAAVRTASLETENLDELLAQLEGLSDDEALTRSQLS
ncbi:MAG TPA: amino acid adenylation domain-containing protein [Thermoanaerobaculia bacterium]|nr:amino acid adenylation domain-containing protein [Thermoanaerobaculia bacterium]